MSMLQRRLSAAVLVAALMLTFQARIDAYIDPGPSFMLWQSLIGGIVGLAVFFQQTLRRLFRFVLRRHEPSDSPPQP
jgi:hypothetical protein